MAIQTDTRVDTPRNRGSYEAPHMTPVTPAEDFRTIMLNRVSWGAVSAGVAMALAVHLVLNLGGIAIGAVTIDPYTGESPTAEALSVGALIWWTIAGILAALAGGFTAGRLAGEPKESTAGWHGLTSWAVSVVLIAALMTTAAGALMGGNFRVMTDITRDRTAMTVTDRADMTANPSVGDEYGSPFATTTDTTGMETDTDQVTGATTDTGVSSAVDTEAAADALARASFFSAIALVLGALAAWFGGRAGAVSPTITARSLRSEGQLH